MSIASGCADDPNDPDVATVRYRVGVILEVDGETREFGHVLETRFERFEQTSLMGFGGASKTKGEMAVIDLGEIGRFYMLPVVFGHTSSFATGNEVALMDAFGVYAAIGGMKREDIAKMKTFAGRRLYRFAGAKNITFGPLDRPAIVGFDDESDPRSVYRLNGPFVRPVDRDWADVTKGRVKLVDFFIEITSDPITDGTVERYLPWVRKEQPEFPSRLEMPINVRGAMEPEEMPFMYIVRKRHFGAGS